MNQHNELEILYQSYQSKLINLIDTPQVLDPYIFKKLKYIRLFPKQYKSFTLFDIKDAGIEESNFLEFIHFKKDTFSIYAVWSADQIFTIEIDYEKAKEIFDDTFNRYSLLYSNQEIDLC